MVATFRVIAWCLLFACAVGGEVTVTVRSLHSDPVLLVRVGECASGETRCDEDSVVSWSLGRATRQDTTRVSDETYAVTFTISYSGNLGGTRLLFMRVEYSSESEALRPQEVAMAGRPSFVGSRIANAWPLVVSGGAEKTNGHACGRGESYEGEGWWSMIGDSRRKAWLACPEDEENSREWRWIPEACEPRLDFGRNEAVDCFQSSDFSLTIMGDSILRYVSERLDCDRFFASLPAESLRKWHVKGPVPKRLSEIEEIFKEHEKNVTSGISQRGGILVLNVAGLWQAAYGDVGDYEASVEHVVSLALNLFDTVVMWLTTAVHPVHFLGLYDNAPEDRPQLVSSSRLLLRRKKRNMLMKKEKRRYFKDAQTKRAMTQPRVAALVRAERSVAERRNLQVFDASMSTAIREDDPLTPTDMRHYGPSTIAELTELLLNFICTNLR